MERTIIYFEKPGPANTDTQASEPLESFTTMGVQHALNVPMDAGVMSGGPAPRKLVNTMAFFCAEGGAALAVQRR